MAGKVLGSYVHVTKDDGSVVILEPGQELPAWASELVTNPAAFADEATVDPGSESGNSEEGYAGQSVDELKTLLKDRELPVSGKKPELVARLEQDDAEKAASGSESGNSEEE